jgi:hypothetical protein
MHKQHVPAQPAFESAVVTDEQTRGNQSPATDGSNRRSEYLRPSIEMAVEWAHLGGD